MYKKISTGFAVAVIAIIAGYLGIMMWPRSVVAPVSDQPENIQKAVVADQPCTEEAKLCPDGSSVGRTGSNCEFEACPGESDFSGWQVYENEKFGIELAYPDSWRLYDGSAEKDNLLIINIVNTDNVGNWKLPGFYIANINESGNFNNVKSKEIFEKSDAVDRVINIEFEKDKRKYWASCSLYADSSSVDSLVETCNKILASIKPLRLVGDDRDKHGCIGSAGYSWCEEKQKCLRSWEESCASLLKTFSNSELGFSFKYPADWKRVSDMSDSVPAWVSRDAVFKISHTQDYPQKDFPLDAMIEVSELSNPNNMNLQQIFDDRYEKCVREQNNAPGFGCIPQDDTSAWKNMQISGKTALRSGKRNIPEGLPTDSVYIKLNKKYLIISLIYYNLKGDIDAELGAVFNQVLDTFKIQ